MANVADFGDSKPKTKEELDAESSARAPASGGDAAPVSGDAASNFNAANAAPKPQGSGQFTNLNTFLNANKNAGTQIGNTIQSGITQDLSGKERQANTQAESFKKGAIAGAQGNLTTGVGLLGNVGGDTSGYAGVQPVNAQAMDYSGMMSLANDPNKLNTFTGLRSGATQQQDATALQSGQENVDTAARQANQQFDTRKNQLQGETNRFGLLNEFLGNKTYNKGTQALDQAFLQKDKTNALGNLQKNVQSKAGDFEALNKNAANLAKEAGTLKSQGQTLATDLTGQTAKNSGQLIEDLGSTQALSEVNDQRSAEQKSMQDAFQIMKNNPAFKGKVIGDTLWNSLGLKGPNTYDVLNNLNDVNQIANLSKQSATGYQNTATQRDVDIYDALTKLSGEDNSKLNADVLAQGKLDEAAAWKTGTDRNSLANLIAEREKGVSSNLKDTLDSSLSNPGYVDQMGIRGMDRDKMLQTLLSHGNLNEFLPRGSDYNDYVAGRLGNTAINNSLTNVLTRGGQKTSNLSSSDYAGRYKYDDGNYYGSANIPGTSGLSNEQIDQLRQSPIGANKPNDNIVDTPTKMNLGSIAERIAAARAAKGKI